MKASDLIKRLTDFIVEYGDLPVVFPDYCFVNDDEEVESIKIDYHEDFFILSQEKERSLDSAVVTYCCSTCGFETDSLCEYNEHFMSEQHTRKIFDEYIIKSANSHPILNGMTTVDSAPTVTSEEIEQALKMDIENVFDI